jgi:transcriptional regulator with XRE-family HTH domain
MSATQRTMARAKERSNGALRETGRELRDARVTRGLSQRSVSIAIGVSQAQVSLIERAEYPTVTVLTLWRFAAAVGLDLSLKAFPGGAPLRDKAHIDLLNRFKAAVGTGWRWFSEVPLALPGDRRAWDRVMRGFGLGIAVEAETRPTDAQELGRRLALKKRDGRVDRLILVLPNSRWCRTFVALNELESVFPVRGRPALMALRAGRDPGGDAIILI